jgi:23S rRNA pseudouridine1911/1915/1917 synthase
MKNILVDKANSNVRLDKFLAKEFFSLGMTRGDIVRNINNGKILVNGKESKPSYALKKGDEIEAEMETREKAEKLQPNSDIKVEVIYDDQNIVVINKPAGISVHPGSAEQKDTLVNGILAKFPEVENIHDQSGDSYLRPGIVHRLDKETSGVMVVARNTEAFQELKNLFKFRDISKKYMALVYGNPKEKEGIIDKHIARAATYRKQVIASGKTKTLIRAAITEYKIIKEFKGYSLVEVYPRTGRMHQIRIHMFSIGHPVVGDKLYKLKNIKAISAPRQMLHAKSIEFKLFGKDYSFSSTLPEDFMKTQKSLEE